MTALWKPMLAAKPDPAELYAAIAKLKYPVAGQLKLDGIRASVQGGKLYARSLKPIANKAMQALWGTKALEGLDGEIIVGPITAEDCFNRTTGQVRRADGGLADAKFYVFDMLDDVEPFVIRSANAKLTIDEAEVPGVVYLSYTECKTIKALTAFRDKARKQGHEGIVTRSLISGYKQGRSTLVDQWLVALKDTVDAEAVILAVYEQEANTNEQKVNELGRLKRSTHKAGKVGKGTLGGFTVAMYGDKKDSKIDWHAAFNIGTGVGLTDAVRAELWAKRKSLVGKVVKFRYQGIGTMNAPRQPIWLGFRDQRDM